LKKNLKVCIFGRRPQNSKAKLFAKVDCFSKIPKKLNVAKFNKKKIATLYFPLLDIGS